MCVHSPTHWMLTSRRRSKKGSRIMKYAIVLPVVLLAACQQPLRSAHADERFYDRSGNALGSSRVDSNGVTTFKDRSGFTTGRARTDSNGTTTFYDKSGNVTGKARR